MASSTHQASQGLLPYAGIIQIVATVDSNHLTKSIIKKKENNKEYLTRAQRYLVAISLHYTLSKKGAGNGQCHK